VLLALALPACTQPPAAEPLPQGEAIPIGTVLSLSGSLAPEGQLTKEGYLFWQDWVNAQGGLEVKGVRHRIQIHIADDESRPSISAQRTEELLSQGPVKLLLGPSAGPATDRSAAVARQHQVPIVVANADAGALYRQGNPYLFGVVGPAAQRLQALTDLAVTTLDPPPQTAAIVYANDSLSTEVAASGRDYATGRGLSVAVYARYPSGTNSVRGQLARVVEAAPDVLLVVGHPEESVTLIKQARELNVQARFIAFTDGPNGELSGGLQKDAEAIFAASSWTPLARTQGGGFLTNADYARQFADKFGHPPDSRSAAATAAGLALGAAIRKAGSVEPAAVREALGGLDFESFFARLHFDARGTNVYRPTYVEQIQNGSRVLVWPPSAATGKPRYPALPLTFANES